MRRLTVFITLFLIFYHVSGQTKWQNATYTPEIKTLRVISRSDFQAPSIISLNSGQQISISFDELNSEMSWLSYRILHCNAEWTLSNISELEYLDGFNQIPVADARPSFNTFTPYYHYSVTIPNNQIQLKLSGNYVVQFFRDEAPDKIIASACFSVAEPLTDIRATVKSNTDIGFNSEYQQVEIYLGWKNTFTGNPAHDLKVMVNQNNRRDNEAVVVNPIRFSSTSAIYEHNRALIFEAGNNYRRFEIVNHKYPGIGVEKIAYFDPMYHVLLSPAHPRADKPYFYDRDQNGHFIIRQSDSDDSDIEADYFMVHFALEDDNPFIEGKIYISGDFTGSHFNEDSQMVYNFERRRYEKTMLLKQGHYNYQYLFLPNNTSKASTRLIEGNFYETDNEYLIRVYFRPPGQRYDRLIGYRIINNNQ